mmetsp:Transcript_4732/g.10231  ORF Transcript_4732/g.10231 Transcript_4732/m.10231 type:complete len:232 (+) Transcript_4732:474-1169(+)
MAINLSSATDSVPMRSTNTSDRYGTRGGLSSRPLSTHATRCGSARALRGRCCENTFGNMPCVHQRQSGLSPFARPPPTPLTHPRGRPRSPSGTLPIAPDLLDGNGWCYQSASYLLPRGLLHEARELYEHEVRTGRRDERTYATLAAQGLRYTREFLTTREVMRRVLHRAIPEVSERALPLLAGNRQPCALISSAPSSSSPPGTTGYRESESRGYSFSRDKIHAFEAEALSV